MAEAVAEAVVLRRRDVGESDRLLHLLTREEGIVLALAKGSRKAGSRLAGASEPLSAGKFDLAASRSRSFVRAAQGVRGWPGLRKDYGKLTGALALAELVDRSLPVGSPAPEVYEWLLAALTAMDHAEDWRIVFAWAAARLLDVEGQRPSWSRAVADGAPLDANPAWVSPMAGGHVAVAGHSRFADAFLARAESLIALERLTDLDEPPPRLKFANETVVAAARYWQAVVGARLPATTALMSFVSHATGVRAAPSP